jgi:hypothetical protein
MILISQFTYLHIFWKYVQLQVLKRTIGYTAFIRHPDCVLVKMRVVQHVLKYKFQNAA